ncbi:MAG: tetratricopeptide repeat protein [Acidobacteriaceae bacterium]|nr:tetratricopeptide repeat protein [Acidobacteriaceae bacterium]
MVLGRTFRPVAFALALLLLTLPATAQSASAGNGDSSGRVVLVLPFENHSGQPGLDWIGESFPTTINQRLGSASFLTITRDDRMFALDHLGLPLDFKPSRATTIRIAQTLDADYVIVGSFTTSGVAPNLRIQAQAQVLRIDTLHLDAPIQDSTPLPRLLDLENALAWNIARQMDPNYNVAQETFLSASAGLQLNAFENYVRGLVDRNPADSATHLQAAVQLQPNYAAAILALGKLQYANQQYEQAAVTLSKLPPGDPLALEAGFYRGLAFFNTGKYANAEKSFAAVALALPLPEVINNQAVAISRQNKDAGALFQRASIADPQDADYHFNIAVTLYRRKDYPGAQREVLQALKLKPSDAESAALRDHIAAAMAGVAPTANDAFDPLERIRRTYSEASFRQAAFQLDQIRALRMAALPPAERAGQLTQLGFEYLDQGLAPEAENQFRSAIAADPRNANAHAGLARLARQNGNLQDARSEATHSLQLHANVPAYLVLAQLELDASNLPAAATYVSSALKLSPNDSAALGMRRALESRGQKLP